MSKQTWAPIVYGRSYYIDFRFITIPEDFGDRDLAWASTYILATTQKARNLSQAPRWSLFKNNARCVIGVTCMVRDLIGNSGYNSLEIMDKDEHGRPLYIFVGYATKLNPTIAPTNFPTYRGTNLDSFQPLYREIEKVWLAHDYDNRKPFLSSYEALGNDVDEIDAPAIEATLPFNTATRYPDKTFVWPRSHQQNNRLWATTAQCLEPTSVCLDIQGKQLVNSPFLNQTITEIEQFRVRNRLVIHDESKSYYSAEAPKSTLKQKISTKAKEDINLTLQQAARVTIASQEMINSLTGNGKIDKTYTDLATPSSERENFGLKTKKKSPTAQDKNWF